MFVLTAQEICTVQSRRALETEQYGDALSWAIRGRNSKLCSVLADLILRNYCVRRDFILSDMLDNLGTAMLMSEQLAFVGESLHIHPQIGSETYS